MANDPETIKLTLTDEQRARIRQLFGQDVSGLTLHVEEFSIDSKEGARLRVLKVEHIGYVRGLSGGGTVN